MSIGKVSIWQLTPEQVENYVPRMDLGKPNKIVAASEIKQAVPKQQEVESKARQRRAIKSRIKERTILTNELYDAEALLGLSDKQIAEMYGIQQSTLIHYKSLWRKRAGAK
ncbi:hypothetical protein ACX1C1_04075 [Paenibacillus sp. strain BS8-2]